MQKLSQPRRNVKESSTLQLGSENSAFACLFSCNSLVESPSCLSHSVPTQFHDQQGWSNEFLEQLWPMWSSSSGWGKRTEDSRESWGGHQVVRQLARIQRLLFAEGLCAGTCVAPPCSLPLCVVGGVTCVKPRSLYISGHSITQLCPLTPSKSFWKVLRQSNTKLHR